MSASPIIQRKSLHGELATLVRNMIVAGELRPGDRISEQDLCARFGVSRTPLREALKVLSAEGLVRLLPNRGATVIRITRREADDLLLVLGVLEAFAGQLACARIDDPGIARTMAMHEQMVEHHRRGQEQPYIELNRAIHHAVLEAAGNSILNEVYRSLELRLSSLQAIRRAPPRWAEAVEDHQHMMEALQARDGPRFADIARNHIQHKVEVVREALDVIDLQARVKCRDADA